MTHALLAGFFCSVGLIFLAVESHFLKRKTSLFFSLFYTIAMLSWFALGIIADSIGLVTISTVQFTCALFLLLDRFSSKI